jgi:hypothetical protein
MSALHMGNLKDEIPSPSAPKKFSRIILNCLGHVYSSETWFVTIGRGTLMTFINKILRTLPCSQINETRKGDEADSFTISALDLLPSQ